MPRSARYAPGGYVYHVLNRAVARLPLFEKPGDYAAFMRVMAEAYATHPIRVLSYCLMPNHWHMVLWPEGDGDLTEFVRWLTHTHTMRWHAHYHTAGTGHVYQGRFKSFPIESNEHLYTVLRYVERNALRANLVKRAEDWPWSSFWARCHGDESARRLLSAWPVPEPRGWLSYVNEAQTESELKALRRSVQRGTPYGSEHWVGRTAVEFGLESTLRPRGRPRKVDDEAD
jgi:REP-associated tyrosine transposase